MCSALVPSSPNDKTLRFHRSLLLATCHCTFESKTLNDKNWVIDFGDLGVLKDFLKKSFDHTTAVAEDDLNAEDEVVT